MSEAVPETDRPTLADVLGLLLMVTTKEELAAVYERISFTEVARNDDERALLTNAAISAAARCWARRWPEDGCD